MAAPDTLNSVTARKLSSVITSLWAKIKNTFQTIGNRVTSIRASSSASDDKYPSEKAVASAIEALDVSSVGGSGKYISAISETDGKISATATTMDTTPTANSTNAVTSGGIKIALDAKVSSITKNGTSLMPTNSVVDIGNMPVTRGETTGTVQEIIQSVRVKAGGSLGSVYVNASTVGSLSIPAKWYNFIWLPHLTGRDSGDNQQYGTLILTPLTNTPDVYVIEGSALAGSSPTYRAIKLANNTDARTISQDVSKGANLVVNGSGRMSSNYNFTAFSYIPTIANGGSAGSFGFSGSIVTDEYISCDFNKKIIISADIKNLVAQPNNCTHRLAIYEYDIDKNQVKAPSVKFGEGTLTTLTQDLNPGDTVVHLADLSNEGWLSSTTHHRGFIFWNYKNSYDYLYPPETYSRNYYPSSDNSVLWDVANVNVAAGTITLNSAWAGPAIPSGTKVSRRNSGGLPYPASSNFFDTEWHSLKGAMKGIIAGGSNSQFSPPTVFIKVGLVPTNLSNTDTVTNKRAVVTNLFVYEEQDINDGFGTLPVNRGGTGATTAIGAEYNILNQVADIDTTVNGDRKIALCNQSKSASNGVFRWIKLSNIWTWIKSQLTAVSGVNISGSSASCTGNAATATKATQDSDGNAINATYFKSSGSTTLVAGAATKIGTQNGADVKLTLPAHQDISGKMNTSASNATAPSSGGGDGATATLLNNLSDGNSDIVTTDNGDNVLIATTDNGGSVTNKWYKRKLVKLIPWIIKKLGTGLVYDCGAGSTSNDDFDAALAAFNAGQWVIIHDSTNVYYCAGTYNSGLRFKRLTNSASGISVNTLNWTRGSSPSAGSQLDASLSGHTHTRSDITNFAHTHGNIQDSGALQTSDITIESGDKLVVTDSSNDSKVARASVSFDGSTTTKALTQKGTFETFMTPSAGNAASGALQNLTGQLTEGTSDFTDNTEIFTSYAGNNGFAESGHVNQPYRRKASLMLNYIEGKRFITRSPATVDTATKRIQLGYGLYTASNVGCCCYLVHVFFNYVDDNLRGVGATLLVNYDWRFSSYQKAKCVILNDNGLRAAGYNIVLANFLTTSNDVQYLHITLGLVKNSAPTTLVSYSYSYCKIFYVAGDLNWIHSVTSDTIGTYNYLIPAEFEKADSLNTSVNAGSANQPVYFNNGVPTACNWWVS